MSLFKTVLVTGKSMFPTLKNGERVLAWTPYTCRLFRRGDIVTLTHYPIPCFNKQYIHTEANFWHMTNQQMVKELFIKRIIGVAGDIVRIPFHKATQPLNCIDPNSSQIGDELIWYVPKKHVFVRGDGQGSIDSVMWGPISIAQLQQIVLCRFPSFKRIQ